MTNPTSDRHREAARPKFYIDTEFIEAGPAWPIELLSIAIVCEDGRELYLENSEANLDNANDWVRQNVFPHLNGPRHSLSEIAGRIRQFVGIGDPEFWGYYADYDWVVFCQIFGAMIDLPKGWPMYCRDLKQLCDSVGNPKLPAQDSTEHNALNDAKWNKIAYEFLVAKHFPSPSSGTGELVEALRTMTEHMKRLFPAHISSGTLIGCYIADSEKALRNAESGRQGDGIFWRGGDRYLREHGKEYRLMDLAPNQETRWIKEHAEAGRQPSEEPTTGPRPLNKQVPEQTISDECKYCAEGEPEWSPWAKCWIHRRERLDRRCTRKRLGPCGEMPTESESVSSLTEAVNSARESWQEKHGKCSMCAIGDTPENGLHRGKHLCGNADSKPSEEGAGEKCPSCGSPDRDEPWCVICKRLCHNPAYCDNSEFHGESAPSAIGKKGNEDGIIRKDS